MLRNGEGIGYFAATILCVQRDKSQREGVYASQDHERLRLHASPSLLESLTVSPSNYIPTLDIPNPLLTGWRAWCAAIYGHDDGGAKRPSAGGPVRHTGGGVWPGD